MIPAKELVSVKEDGGSVEPVGAKAAPQRDEQGDGNDIGADQAQQSEAKAVLDIFNTTDQ
jgi:hypothetical protein